MNTKLIIVLLSAILTVFNSFSQNNYKKQWTKIDSLEKKGLYNKALVEVQAIFKKASQSNQYEEVIKSVLFELKYNSYLKEDDYVLGIARLENLVKLAPSPSKEILHSLTAEVYWGYYSGNSWKYAQRTVVESDVDLKDIRTWDLKRIGKKVIHHYLKSLENEGITQTKPIDSFKKLIKNTNVTKDFRPNLYDFLAHRAISFFSNNTFNVEGPAETFTVNNKDYFSTNTHFLNLDISTNDSLNTSFYAALIYKSLTDYHLRHNHTNALLMLELNRLEFAKNKSVLSNKNELFNQSLKRMTTVYPNNPYISEVWYLIANEHYTLGKKYSYPKQIENKDELKIAMDICKKTISKFPKAYGSEKCKNLISLITEKEFTFKSESAITPKKENKILLNYKNVKKIYLKIVPIKTNKYLKDFNPENYIDTLIATEAIYTKTIELINPNDFQLHSVEILIPSLNTGQYAIITSTSPNFKKDNEALNYNTLWVTNLTFQTNKTSDNGKVLVTNRINGEPVKDAKVTVMWSKYNYKNYSYETKILGSYKTNEQGIISFKPRNKSTSYFFAVEKGKDYYQTINGMYIYKHYNSNSKPTIDTEFFTDRKIYRPGQTIYFKGIAIETNGKKHTLKTNWKSTVQFYDVNYQLIKQLDVETNEFGSFTGQFTAPFGVLTGNMRIMNGHGATDFNVEEYKRPKFSTNIEPLTGEYKLNDSIHITGVATAFAGNPIDGATVSYTITRSTRYSNNRWGWWYHTPSASKVISFGETTTNEKGEYIINFKAIPDLTKDAKTLPIFNYTIAVDVVDINGETHSTSSVVSVGFHSLLLSNNLPAEFTNNTNRILKISTTNLNAQPISAKGNITINLLQSPNQTYRKRLWSAPEYQTWTPKEFKKLFPLDEYQNENDFHNWPKAKEIFTSEFNTQITDSINLINIKNWPAGRYIYEAITTDKNGFEVKDVKYFEITNCCESKLTTNQIFKAKLITPSVQPGKIAKICLSTAEKNMNVYYSISRDNLVIEEKWIHLSNEQKLIEIEILEEYRGNISIYVSTIKNNRTYSFSQIISVPYENKTLDLEFSTFRNKLLPGQNEEWIMTIKNNKGEKEMAELMATLYDASLDELTTPNSFYMTVYQQYYSKNNWTDHRGIKGSTASNINYNWNTNYSYSSRYFPKLNYFGYQPYYYGQNYGYRYKSASRNYDSDGVYEVEGITVEASELASKTASYTFSSNKEDEELDKKSDSNVGTYANIVGGVLNIAGNGKDEQQNNSKPLSAVKARTNFNETAFFFPQLLTDKDGNIKIKFTIPESLTKWQFLGLAHTKDLKIGTISENVITQKDLMVIPNTPRFLREGDDIIISTKISNMSKNILNGNVLLQLIDPNTNKVIDQQFNLTNATQNFEAKVGQSTSISWHIKVPYNLSTVSYKIVAQAGNFSDGESNVLPILTNRMLVTESMPLPIRGLETKTFNFKKLQNANQSSTLKHHKYTLEFTSNPAWYAVQAIPYMMEYPHECAEQTFTRYYSNAIATHIMNSSPKIKQVIENWGENSPEAFLSNLQKNEELKSLLLEETPWVLDAKSESQSKKNLSILLDMNRMSKEIDKALGKTIKSQSSNGGWPWFPGMKESRYITQHIITGLGHLDHLGITNIKTDSKTKSMIEKGIKYLDNQIVKDFESAKKWDKNYLKNQHIGYNQIQYLYARSYFTEITMTKATKEAVNYYKNQAKTYWLKFNVYAKGMIALSANRMDMIPLANDIVNSLKDNAIQHDEFGMYWKSYTSGFSWYEAPVETQALMIEMFDEITNDQESVESLKVWLLKQKQTTNWKTTKQTSEAVYALLLKGTDLLSNDKMVEITVGNEKIKYTNKTNDNPYEVNTQAGTGYFKTAWSENEIKPEMGKITVKKETKGVAWGAAYWQYFEDLDKITYAETPLKLNKELYIITQTEDGELLTKITNENTLKIGDKIKVRIELRTDRNLEYVHMKDMRASTFEPLNVLSSYKYREGLGYYEATKDASTNFFFDYIPKGTYVFEYDLRVQHEGEFSNGITTIQCMYAPEFTSHSNGIRVEVKK